MKKINVPSRYRKMEYLHLLIEMGRILQPEVYCELGTYKGFTFNRMLPYVGHAYGIDIKDYRRCMDTSRRNWEFYQGTSAQFAKQYQGEPIDMLFIDAHHSAQAVLNDVEAMQPLMRPNTGMVFLHDTYPIQKNLLQPSYCGDAWRAAKELHKNYPEWEIVTLPLPWAGLSIMRLLEDGCHGWMESEER